MTNSNKTVEERPDWLKRFNKLANTYVGQGGWGCVTDNDEGIAIWPESYKAVMKFIQSELELRDKQLRESVKQWHKDIFPEYTDELEKQRHKTFLAVIEKK